MFTHEYYYRVKFIVIVGLGLTLSLVLIGLNLYKLKTLSLEKSNYSLMSNIDSLSCDIILLDHSVEDEDFEYSLSQIEVKPEYLDIQNSKHDEKRLAIEKEAMELRDYYSKFNPKNKDIIKTEFNTIDGIMKLPNIKDTSFKGYMCLHKVKDKTSKQWRFLHSGEFTLTTDKNGMLKYGDYYVVAMASYYTNYKIGSTFRITLDSGTVFDVIVGDAKADIHTDYLNMYRPKSGGRGEIVEFIIACGETGANCNKYKTMPKSYRVMGNLSFLGFKGNVVKIQKLSDTSVVNLLYGN